MISIDKIQSIVLYGISDDKSSVKITFRDIQNPSLTLTKDDQYTSLIHLAFQSHTQPHCYISIEEYSDEEILEIPDAEFEKIMFFKEQQREELFPCRKNIGFCV